MRILVAEDEKTLNSLMEKKLKKEGYSVDCVYNGEDAVDYALAADYDCILLDIMMPVKDGFEVLQSLRERGVLSPVIFLTARDSVKDKIKGLDLGAADYIVKPFSFEELMARIRANTRQKEGGDCIYRVADLELNTADHSVKRGGVNITLSAKEYQMLKYMMKNAGRVLTRENIEDHIWNFDYEGGTNVVDVYIRYLRRKIDDGFDKKLIKTVRGAGYSIGE